VFLSRRRLVAALLSLVLLSPLVAEDAEIVVTATKEPTPAETLPVGVTVIDQSALEAAGTVADALKSTLAVRLDEQLAGRPTLVAPGFGDNGFARTVLLIDGINQANSEMVAPSLNVVPTFALDRIEVLSAGAPALYGSGSVTGAVNLVTKVPTKFEAEASASIDTTLTNRQSVGAALPVGPGGILLSVSRDQNLPTRDRSDSDQYQGWVQFVLPWNAGGVDQELRTWASVSRSTYQLPGSLLTADYLVDPTLVRFQSDEGSQTESKGFLSWGVTTDRASLTLPVSGTYRATRSQYTSSSSFYDTVYATGSFSPRGSLDLGSLAGADLDLSGGVDAVGSRLTVDRYASSAFSTKTMEAVIDRGSAAGWTRIQASWSDRFLVSAAGRAEAVRTQASSVESPVINDNKDMFPLSGQAGITWLPLEHLKVGLEGARVYRVPLTDEMISYYGDTGYGNYDFFLKNLEPETGLSASASASWTTASWSVSASSTVLAMDNEIVYDTTTYSNANIGKTNHFTALVQSQYSWTGWLKTGADYSFERAVYASGTNDGKSVPLVPAHRAKVWAELAWDHWGTAEASWQGTSSYVVGNDESNSRVTVSSRQDINAAVTVFLGSKDLRLKLSANNLANDRTPTSVYYSSYSGNTGWYPTEGRTFGATVTWKL